MRPGCRDFLRELSPHFNLVIFTASTRDYAVKILQGLEDREKYFCDLMSREHCTIVDGNYLKDMRNVKNVPLQNLVLIDNLISSFALQLAQGIPIKPYISGSGDRELSYIA